MLIFDSFTTPFRNINDQLTINKIMNEASMKLVKLAGKYNISVTLLLQ